MPIEGAVLFELQLTEFFYWVRSSPHLAIVPIEGTVLFELPSCEHQLVPSVIDSTRYEIICAFEKVWKHVVILSLTWNRLLVKITWRYQTDEYFTIHFYHDTLTVYIYFLIQKGNILFCTDKMTQRNIQHNNKKKPYIWEADENIVTHLYILSTSTLHQLTMLSRSYNVLRHPLKYMLFMK